MVINAEEDRNGCGFALLLLILLYVLAMMTFTSSCSSKRTSIKEQSEITSVDSMTAVAVNKSWSQEVTLDDLNLKGCYTLIEWSEPDSLGNQHKTKEHNLTFDAEKNTSKSVVNSDSAYSKVHTGSKVEASSRSESTINKINNITYLYFVVFTLGIILGFFIKKLIKTFLKP